MPAFGLPAAAVFEGSHCAAHIQGAWASCGLSPIASVLGFLTNIPLSYALMRPLFPKWGGWLRLGDRLFLWLSAAVLWFDMTRAEGLGRYLPPCGWCRPPG